MYSSVLSSFDQWFGVKLNNQSLGSFNFGQNLNDSTIHSWVKNYKSELERKRKAGDPNPDVQVLPVAKRGHPFLLGRSFHLLFDFKQRVPKPLN